MNYVSYNLNGHQLHVLFKMNLGKRDTDKRQTFK